MTEKELKKLSRIELLELLIEQTERNEELERKLAETQQKLTESQQELERAKAEIEQEVKNQPLNVKEVGTLAEACLQVNKVFVAADAAAKQYLANIKVYEEKKKEMLAETERRCIEMEQLAEAKVATLKAEVDLLSQKWLRPTPTEE